MNTFWNDDFFFNKVKYVENIESVYNSLIKLDCGKMSLRLNDIGSFKHIDWSFQEECRFRLIILPNVGNDIGDKRYIDYLMSCIRKEIYAPFRSYFLKLKEDIFNDAVITLSPFSTEADKIIVHALCQKYAPNARIVDSSLKNRIRLK